MILRPVLRNSYAELLHAPVRLALVALLSLGPLVSAYLRAVPPSAGVGALFGAILGAGLIGKPLSNGTLGLLFTRPLRRADYVVTRWLAATSAAGLGVLLLQSLAAFIQTVRFGHFEPAALSIAVGEDVLAAAGVVAVLVLLSTLVAGIGDVALLALLLIVAKLAGGLGSYLASPRLTWFGTLLHDLVRPSLDLTTTFTSSPPSWYAVAAYLSTVTLCLALAVERVRRKEISYASGE